jgi:hypothetical protein
MNKKPDCTEKLQPIADMFEIYFIIPFFSINFDNYPLHYEE